MNKNRYFLMLMVAATSVAFGQTTTVSTERINDRIKIDTIKTISKREIALDNIRSYLKYANLINFKHCLSDNIAELTNLDVLSLQTEVEEELNLLNNKIMVVQQHNTSIYDHGKLKDSVTKALVAAYLFWFFKDFYWEAYHNFPASGLDVFDIKLGKSIVGIPALLNIMAAYGSLDDFYEGINTMPKIKERLAFLQNVHTYITEQTARVQEA